ncbi:MAG: hypothetical protein Q8R57_13220 [Bacteroidota bacterium]|nr:hypothetical protein [Bacteroidota bacterium]
MANFKKQIDLFGMPSLCLLFYYRLACFKEGLRVWKFVFIPASKEALAGEA